VAIPLAEKFAIPIAQKPVADSIGKPVIERLPSRIITEKSPAKPAEKRVEVSPTPTISPPKKEIVAEKAIPSNGELSKTALCGNLASSISISDLLACFKTVKGVKNIRLYEDFHSFERWAEIDFNSQQQADSACELDGVFVCGIPIKVTLANIIERYEVE